MSRVNQSPERKAYVKSGKAIPKGTRKRANSVEKAMAAFVKPGIARIAAKPARRCSTPYARVAGPSAGKRAATQKASNALDPTNKRVKLCADISSLLERNGSLPGYSAVQPAGLSLSRPQV
jgi:hypothetical protein